MARSDTGDLGRLLKQRRVMASLTALELAHQSGVSPSYLGRIERGERFPSARVLRKIARPLGSEESDLFTLAGYLSPQSSTGAESKAQLGQLDPYVAAVLSQEPAEVQRAVISILGILKSMAKSNNESFAEYVHRKYPEVDEDIITMVQDVLEHPSRKKEVMSM